MPQVVRRDRRTSAAFTALVNHPFVDFGRGRYPPSDPGNTRSPGALPRHWIDSSSKTNTGTGTERALPPLVGPYNVTGTDLNRVLRHRQSAAQKLHIPHP